MFFTSSSRLFASLTNAGEHYSLLPEGIILFCKLPQEHSHTCTVPHINRGTSNSEFVRTFILV